MPVTLRNTDILFNDGTTQNTAAGAVTTTAVLNATAGASVGAVGTYAFLLATSIAAPGDTRAGSSLSYSAISTETTTFYSSSSIAGGVSSIGIGGGSPAGTWRVMAVVNNFGAGSVSLWLRIS